LEQNRASCRCRDYPYGFDLILSSCPYAFENSLEFAFVRRKDCWFPQEPKQVGRMVLERSQCVSVERDSSLGREHRRHHFPCLSPHPATRSDHDRIESFVSEKFGEPRRAGEWLDHHGGEMSGVDRYGIGRACDTDQPRPDPKRGPCCQTRSSRRVLRPTDNDTVTARIFVAIRFWPGIIRTPEF